MAPKKKSDEKPESTPETSDAGTEATPSTGTVSTDGSSDYAVGGPLYDPYNPGLVIVGQPTAYSTSRPGMIFGKMIELYREVNAIAKTEDNAQQHFKFRGIDQVYNALHPKFAKVGVFPVPEVVSFTQDEFTNNKGTKFARTTLNLKVTFYAEDGSYVTAGAVGEGMDMADKATSKSMSMAMKYAMFATLTIPTHDEDADASSPSVIGRGDAPQEDRDNGTDVPARSKRSRVERTKPKEPEASQWSDSAPEEPQAPFEGAQAVQEAAKDIAGGPLSVAALGEMNADDLSERLANLPMDKQGLADCRVYHGLVTQCVKSNLISADSAKEMFELINLRGRQIKEVAE